MLGSRFIRVAAAAFVFIAVAALLVPRATGYVSTFAVVNAPVLTVRAPLNGIVVSPTPGLASPVSRDEVLFDLQSTQTRRTEAERLRTELAVRNAEAGALRAEEMGVERVITRLLDRLGVETENELVYLTRQLERRRAERRIEEIAWDRARDQLYQVQALHGRGMVPDNKLQEAQYVLREAEARLDVMDAVIDSLRVEIRAIENGVVSPGGTGRRNAAEDRLGDMRMARDDIRTRRIAAEARRDAIKRELRALQGELDALERFRPTAATNGLIWTASRQAGASVTLGSDLFQILDCERRFLEVFFEERAFEDLPPGTRARVRFRGASNPITATVMSRHAAGDGSALPTLETAIASPTEARGVKVYLRIEPADTRDPAVAASFCDVGRTAEVRIAHQHYAKLVDPVRELVSEWWVRGTSILAKRESAPHG